MNTNTIGWFFPATEEASQRPPQNTKQVMVVTHDLNMDHPPEMVVKSPFRHIPTDLEEK